MKKELYSYQKENATKALELIKEHHLVFLVFDIRTGKTCTSLEICKQLGTKSVLFITMKNAIQSIKEDYEDFGYGFRMTVVNYESLHKIEQDKWDMVIVDEAHKISRYPGQSKFNKQICSFESKYHIFLSATPSAETLSQLYHILKPSKKSPWNNYKSFYAWHKDYGIPGKKWIGGGRMANDYSKTKQDKVMEDFNKISMSFSQQQAGFSIYPEEEEYIISAPRVLQKSIDLLRKDKVLNTSIGDITCVNAASEMSKIHQMCGGSILHETEEGERITKVISTYKGEWIKEHAKQFDKIAIIYKFKAELEILKEVFGSDNITSNVEEFRDRDDKVFCGQFQSVSFGVNLSTTDAMYLYSLDYSSATYQQILGRGQTKDRVKPLKIIYCFDDLMIKNTYIVKNIKDVLKDKKKYTSIHFDKL